MATFQNKKKDWFSHKTELVLVYGDGSFKDGSRNSATFKMEFFSTIGNGRVYNQWIVVFACCCVTRLRNLDCITRLDISHRFLVFFNVNFEQVNTDWE